MIRLEFILICIDWHAPRGEAFDQARSNLPSRGRMKGGIPKEKLGAASRNFSREHTEIRATKGGTSATDGKTKNLEGERTKNGRDNITPILTGKKCSPQPMSEYVLQQELGMRVPLPIT